MSLKLQLLSSIVSYFKYRNKLIKNLSFVYRIGAVNKKNVNIDIFKILFLLVAVGGWRRRLIDTRTNIVICTIDGALHVSP